MKATYEVENTNLDLIRSFEVTIIALDGNDEFKRHFPDETMTNRLVLLRHKDNDSRWDIHSYIGRYTNDDGESIEPMVAYKNVKTKTLVKVLEERETKNILEVLIDSASNIMSEAVVAVSVRVIPFRHTPPTELQERETFGVCGTSNYNVIMGKFSEGCWCMRKQMGALSMAIERDNLSTPTMLDILEPLKDVKWFITNDDPLQPFTINTEGEQLGNPTVISVS